MKKIAIIREHSECPFGLPVSQACKIVGAGIYNMVAIEDKDPELIVELKLKVVVIDEESNTSSQLGGGELGADEDESADDNDNFS